MNSDLHFRESNITIFKLFLYFVFSVSFLIIDKNLEFSNKIRKNSSYIIQPIYLVAAFPSKVYKNISIHLASKNSLILENKNLEKKVFIQSGIIQKIPALKAENKRLKRLLGSSNSRDSSKILIEIKVQLKNCI